MEERNSSIETITLTLSFYPKWKERCIRDSPDGSNISDVCHGVARAGFAMDVLHLIQGFLADRWIMKAVIQRKGWCL